MSSHLPTSIEFHLPVEKSNSIVKDEKNPNDNSIKYDKYKWDKRENILQQISQKFNSLHLFFIPAVLFFVFQDSTSNALKVLKNLFNVVCRCLKIVPREGNKNHGYIWFDRQCSDLKKQTHQRLRKFRKTREQADFQTYLDYKHRLKEIKKEKKAAFWEKKITKMTDLCNSSNTSQLWKEIKGHMGKFSAQNTPKISVQSWVNHFDKVLNKKPARRQEWSLEGKVNNTDENFESPISYDEVHWSLGRIRHGKAPGVDSILGDFLKFFRSILVTPLQALFNLVWASGYFPAEWARSIIVPIHKKGPTSDPNNFRGIALLSHLGKVLTRILNRRLVKWINANNLLSDVQAGFRKGYSTLNNIFILDTVIQDRMSRKNKSLYCCFVDIKKCFDWIDRGALFYKLYGLGLPGRMMNLLQNYYSKSEFSVRLDNSTRSKSRKSISGVFQGCQMSPQLFTLFINDVVDFLNVDGIHAPEILGTIVHCLLYADDLVLMSCSPIGLQRMLDRLALYCKKWELEVSLDKTKVVVFKKSRKKNKNEKWFYNDKKIEVVNEYKYLGVVFSGSGACISHIQQAKIRTERSCIALLKFFFKFKFLPISFFLKLYDSMVASVLLYGSEVWGGHVFSNQGIDLIESTAYKFYKALLGLPKSTQSSGVLLELSRLKMKDYMLISIVRFFLRLSSLDSERLVSKCFARQVELANAGKQCWGLQVKKVLDCLGLSNFWTRGGQLNKKQAMKIIKQRVKDVNRQSAIEEAKSKPSLSLYVNFKENTAPVQEYDKFSPQKRREVALVRLNLKRSLPVTEQDGALVCRVCKKHVIGYNDSLWVHYFIKGCTIAAKSEFKERESYKDVVERSVKNIKSFVNKNDSVLKKLSIPSSP